MNNFIVACKTVTCMYDFLPASKLTSFVFEILFTGDYGSTFYLFDDKVWSV